MKNKENQSVFDYVGKPCVCLCVCLHLCVYVCVCLHVCVCLRVYVFVLFYAHATLMKANKPENVRAFLHDCLQLAIVIIIAF